jgi:site-specific DNA-methyltransferase (adenine-specific)
MIELGYFNEDCMEGMKRYPNKYFDLAIIDTPYGLNLCMKNQSGGTMLAKKKNYKSFGDLCAPQKEFFDELFRVSKNQIIWGANHFISKIPFDSSCWIVWDKENGENDFADCELAWTSFKKAVRKFKFKWQGMLQGDMKNKEHRIHPTQKPVALYTWLLNNYAKQGDKILDTHVGSASSLIACHRLGFDYVGFEIDPYYYKLSSERLVQEKAQVSMFELLNDSGN